jgi:hypothetical protein
MDYAYVSHHQKKRASALLKTLHRKITTSKRSLDFSKDKGRLKTYRNQERHQKNNISIEPRQYYCNRCKVWNNVVECDGCYVDWCGVNDDYHHCDFGQHDLCSYHIDNFYTNNNSYEAYRTQLGEQEYQDRISDIQWRGLMAQVGVLL